MNTHKKNIFFFLITLFLQSFHCQDNFDSSLPYEQIAERAEEISQLLDIVNLIQGIPEKNKTSFVEALVNAVSQQAESMPREIKVYFESHPGENFLENLATTVKKCAADQGNNSLKKIITPKNTNKEVLELGVISSGLIIGNTIANKLIVNKQLRWTLYIAAPVEALAFCLLLKRISDESNKKEIIKTGGLFSLITSSTLLFKYVHRLGTCILRIAKINTTVNDLRVERVGLRVEGEEENRERITKIDAFITELLQERLELEEEINL
jgi:hypothetical protein